MGNSTSKKILFVVEGAKTETRHIKKIVKKLLTLTNEKYKFLIYGTDIYDLYYKYVEGEYDYLIDYLVAEKGLENPEGLVPSQIFSAIYLIFDFEPQATLYSDEIIKNCLEIFNNETTVGKLYLNYPMFEAIKHFKSWPDPDFLSADIECTNSLIKSYKQTVGEMTCIPDSRKYDKAILLKILNHVLDKFMLICYPDNIKVDEGEPLNYLLLLEKQLEYKKTKNKIYIINTSILFVVDYNPSILNNIDTKGQN